MTGIRANAVSPEYMMTKRTAKILDENPELKVYLSLQLIANSGLLSGMWHTMTSMGRVGSMIC
jgi:NAD(P)-dependent dehydrogenase (short-subunit alcohol dehydrogenase family)